MVALSAITALFLHTLALLLALAAVGHTHTLAPGLAVGAGRRVDRGECAGRVGTMPPHPALYPPCYVWRWS